MYRLKYLQDHKLLVQGDTFSHVVLIEYNAGGGCQCTLSKQQAIETRNALKRSTLFCGFKTSLRSPQNVSRQQKGQHPCIVSALTWNDIPRIVQDIPYRRSITPPFSNGLDIEGTEVFNFLFPDGNILTAHWTSYAILALVLAAAVELSTRVLMLLSQEPPSQEELSKVEARAMKAEAREAAEERREQAKLERERRLRMFERVAKVKQKRLQDVRESRKRPPASGTADAGLEETVPSQEELQVGKYVFKDYIVEERYRGLKWLSIATLMAIWVTGVLNKDSPLAP